MIALLGSGHAFVGVTTLPKANIENIYFEKDHDRNLYRAKTVLYEDQGYFVLRSHFKNVMRHHVHNHEIDLEGCIDLECNDQLTVGDTNVDNCNGSDDESAVRRQQAATTVLLLGNLDRRIPKSTKEVSQRTSAPVGETRIGSVTKMNRNHRDAGKIFDAIRKTAKGSILVERSNQLTNITNKEGDECGRPSTGISQTRIHSAIEDMFRKQTNKQIGSHETKITSVFSTIGKTIGVLGETAQRHVFSTFFRPGSVILEASTGEDVTVRIATPLDDVDIANLRLSVFSDFSQELRNHFCTRSCQAIASRRLRGASCVVATIPRKVSDNVNVGCHHSIIVGTAECSFHEFFGTQLGRRRPSNSILYVTEVAVNPSVRRQGVGTKLMTAISMLAQARGIESLYLHVDVKNNDAIKLYNKCGYHRVDSDHPMYLEFTTSLNLHSGATKGRDHFLFCRNLRTDPTWLDDCRVTNRRLELVGTLGFEIPA